MSAPTLVCLALGSKEIEAVTTIDLLVRGGIKVATTSIASDDNLVITCSRGVKLLADAPLAEVADDEYDVIVPPGGIKSAECFRDSALLVETVKQFYRSGHIVTTIYATPATVLVPYDIFSIGDTTGFSTLKDKVPVEQRQDKRVTRDIRVKLLTNQRPGTATDFGLKITDLLVERERAHEVVLRLVMAVEIYNYYE